MHGHRVEQLGGVTHVPAVQDLSPRPWGWLFVHEGEFFLYIHGSKMSRNVRDAPVDRLPVQLARVTSYFRDNFDWEGPGMTEGDTESGPSLVMRLLPGIL